MARAKLSWWNKALQNKMILIVLTMMVVVPFIATPLDVRNSGMAALVCEGFGIALLVSLMWKKKSDLSKESVIAFFRTGANTPALLFLGVIAVSLARSPHFQYSVQEALRLASGVLVYFVVAYQFRRSEHITKAVDLLVYIAIGVSAIAFAQYGIASADTHYATGLFGDHQLLGSFLMLLLPFVAITAITEKTPNKQLVAQIGTVMTIVALLISQARSAWVGTAAGVLVLAAITLWGITRRSRLVQRKHELVMPAMLLVVAIGFFFLLSPEAGNIGDRIQSTVNSHSSAVEYRKQLATGAINMIKERPLAGQGVGLYSLYQARYTGSGLPVWMLHDKAGHFARPGMGEMAHDLYLQTAAELGIPGVLIFLTIPVCFIVGGLRKVIRMDAGIRRSVLLAAIASTVAFAIDAAGSPSWQYGQVSMFFWLTLGLGVGSLRPRNKHYSATREVEEYPEHSAPATPSLGFMRGAGLVAGIALAIVMVPSVIYASPPGYLIPKSADLEPKGAVIFSFQTQAFTLTVTFTDNSVYDVTLEPTTVFSITTAHQGSLGGPNNSVYQASIGSETITVKGAYTQNAVTVSDTAQLSVQRGG